MLVTLFGCAAPGAAGSETTLPETLTPETEPPVQLKTIIADGKTEYTVIRGDRASDSDIQCAVRVREAIISATGAKPSMGDDWVRNVEDIPAAAAEIVIGATNRPQTVAAKTADLRARDWGIYFTDDRLTIVGGCDEATSDAADYFIANYLETAKDGVLALPDGFSYVYRHAYPIGELTLGGTPLRDYVIVVPQQASLYEKYAAAAFNDYLETHAGYTLTVADDSAEPHPHELLFGATARPASARHDGKTYGEMEYLLTVEGGHVVLRGDSYMIGGAVGALTALMREAGEGELRVPTTALPAKFRFADTPKSAILLIGDGMGANQINLTLDEGGLDEFAARRFPNQGEAKTRSASSAVTDSAASGTALSSGYKTINGYLGLDARGTEHINIRELAASRGARTAVVTSDKLTGATPAAFTAHVIDRNMSTEISAQQAALEIEYLRSCNGKVLVNESRAALNIIANGDADSFFIMIEEAYIDKNSHSNATDDVISCVKYLNETAAYVSQFVFLHPDTAFIVTADHECGGIQQRVGGKYYFTSTSHTGVNVPVSALGAGTEFFADRVVDNTEIAKFMGRIWGEPDLGSDAP